jgi:hypothetical protein
MIIFLEEISLKENNIQFFKQGRLQPVKMEKSHRF